MRLLYLSPYPKPHFVSRKKSKFRHPHRFLGLVSLAVVLGIGFRTIESFGKTPQAVLVLGGATEREAFAANFAKEHPDLPIWVSSGSNPEYAEWVFSEAGIAPERLHLDYQAVDTVTNFTTLVDDFKARGITSIYVITSDYHMRRARVIGEIVLGSRGISFKPIVVPSQHNTEPMNKAVRDGVRSILWVTTGKTGADLAQQWSHR